MKGIFAWILVLAVLLVGCSAAAPGETSPAEETAAPSEPAATEPVVTAQQLIQGLALSDTEKKELLQAAELGFSMEKIAQDSISGKEMAVLLDQFVTLVAPENLALWQGQYPALRSSTQPINRFNALGAVYLAATAAGGDWPAYQAYPFPFFQSVPSPWESGLDEKYMFHWNLFDGVEWQGKTFLCGRFGRFTGLDAASHFYNMARISPVSGEYLFSYDAQANSFHWDKNPTYAEAVLAVIRLMASDPGYPIPYEPGEADQPYLAQADERREAIRTTENDCTEGVTGTIYYISNQGSDDNSGKSPEEPWATLDPVYRVGLRSGDAVLFERGGTWHLKQQNFHPFNLPAAAVLDLGAFNGGAKNVTVGAYGSGSKPVLRGDIPEANDPAFWELYSDENGVKIWKTTEALVGTNVIVFNEGESCATQNRPYWDGGTSWITPAGDPFTPETSLTEDLTFTWMPELTPEYQKLLKTSRQVNLQARSPIYLRCDQGNPAEVYDTVSLSQSYCALSLEEGCTASDLDIRYFIATGTGITGNPKITKGQTLRNLEISWCGGFLHRYAEVYDGLGLRGWQPSFTGGGSFIVTNSDMTIENCYYHDCGSRALVLFINDYQGMPKEYLLKDYLISGNLFERCGSALHIADGVRTMQPDKGSFISNLVFEDNMVMNSGYGWSYSLELQVKGSTSFTQSAVENGEGACHNDGIYFRNNLFYRSRYALVSLTDRMLNTDQLVNAQPVFEGNTYVQNTGLPIFQKGDVRVYGTEQEILGQLGDTSGTVVTLK